MPVMLAVLSFALSRTAGAATPAEDAFSKRLPEVCAALQQRGFRAPEELGTKPKAEMRIPGLMYLCNVVRPLAGKGPGRPPEVAALLAGEGDDPGVVLSANVWCALDVEPALRALSDEVELVAGRLGPPPPKEALAAIRAGRKLEAGAPPGLAYRIVPIEVDKDACGKVPPGTLGPVHMKLDVSIRPGKPRPR